MANEISAPFSIRGLQGNQGNAKSPSPLESETRSTTTSTPDSHGVKSEPVQDKATTSRETGNALPPAETPAWAIAEQVSPQEDESEQTELKTALSEVKNHMRSMQRDLQFEVDEVSNRTIVRVVDAETGDVVRQIPAEEFVRMAKRLEEMEGLLMSERV